jgi:hypothetical protein
MSIFSLYSFVVFLRGLGKIEQAFQANAFTSLLLRQKRFQSQVHTVINSKSVTHVWPHS